MATIRKTPASPASSPSAGAPQALAGAPSARAERPGARPLEEELGDRLRALYQDMLNQPIPPKFIRLLEKLDAGR